MSRFKTIYVMPHSHFDYGYTHPQAMLRELQKDYLDQAIELCEKTQNNNAGEAFCWTVEAHEVLADWLRDASAESVDRLKDLIHKGQIAVTALPYHSTPMANLDELWDLFQDVPLIEQRLEYKIRTAINHDVNGQPWPLAELMIQAGVDFYLTGINVHFGGIPFERPCAFFWETAAGKRLRCYLGEHYSLFSQFANSETLPTLMAKGGSDEEIYAHMRQGLAAYEEALAQRSWKQDYYFLTMTNPPLYDNNSPDSFLPQAIQIYNRLSPDQKIEIITIDQLRDISLKTQKAEDLEVKRGDWTDYWNFGAGSTPQETRIHKRGQVFLKAMDYLATVDEPGRRASHAAEKAKRLLLLHSEHTWGASDAINDPYADMTRAQRVHKDHLAWDGVALAAYALGDQLEKLHHKPGSFSGQAEGVRQRVYNPTPYPMSLGVPDLFSELGDEGTSLASLRIERLLPYMPAQLSLEDRLKRKLRKRVHLAPYSFISLKRQDVEMKPGLESSFIFANGELTTPYYRLKWNKKGQLLSWTDREGQVSYIPDEDKCPMPFASLVRERLEPSETKQRKAFFDRNLEDGNLSIANWNPDWKAARDVLDASEDFAYVMGEDSIVLGFSFPSGSGLKGGTILFTLYSQSPEMDIDLNVTVDGQDVPEAYYLAWPLALEEGWSAYYDTAGQALALDQEQIGSVSKDWITQDSFYAAFDDNKGMYIASMDSPLVAPNGFGFARESKRISRTKNPLPLSWLSNNYWETNFNSKVEGLLNSHLSLMPAKSYEAMVGKTLGAKSGEPFLSILTLDNLEEGSHYNFTSDQVTLEMLRPMEDDLVLVFRNLDEESIRTCTFALGRTLQGIYQIEEAYYVNPRKELGEKIPLLNSEESIELNLPAGALQGIYLKLKRRP
jgi:alpha-mannosidase